MPAAAPPATSAADPKLDAPTRLAVNALRALSFEGVEKANSGHPGMPMGAADMAFVLWSKFLKVDPTDPKWFDRDRFVLSAGHGSMLLYSLLHLTGHDVTMDDIKQFRQFGSRTPGHPEYGHTPGVETTTGPLGQGFGNAVGMALAEAMLAKRFNRDGHTLVDHYTYGICGDGDLMEGISAEAASLAGHLGLGKLIFLYDDNGISIDGHTDLAFSTEDVRKRFEAYGWHTQKCDGHNHAEVEAALRAAREEKDRPSIICARTTIGWGSPNKKDTHDVHGSPLGKDEILLTRQQLGWDYPPFEIPAEARAPFEKIGERGRAAHGDWNHRLGAARAAAPELAAEFEKFLKCEIPADLSQWLPKFPGGKSDATRKSGGAVINALAPHLPFLVGGSADLTPSTNTTIKGSSDVNRHEFAGRNFHYGVREHAMVSVNNGIALHGGLIPFGATFLIFSDYCRPAIRLAAIMNVRNITVFTHDSVFLGEDGPTHQPVEHLESLRAIHNLNVIRPGDPNEVSYAWEMALRAHGPSLICLTRQNLPTFDREAKGYAPAAETLRGAYVLKEGKGGAAKLDLLIVATGSELHLAVGAAEELEKEGKSVRVVSMPCERVFELQGAAYVETVMPRGVKKLAVEAGVTRGWRRWVGLEGGVVGLDHFGASAPYQVIAEQFGFTVANVAAAGRGLMK